MQRDINQFQKREYDLLVVGGGINGAAIAHLATDRRMKVALLEKGDFASGTSSKSTKLIHGGLRYLENLEFDLVCESLKERHIQLKMAPHLVRPLGFVIPVYQGDKRPLWMMKLGVFLYDTLAGKYRVKKHKNLNVKQVLKLEPGIKEEGLLGGVMYYDAQMDDARLCLENVLSAAQKGAHVANYAKVVSFIKENGKVVGVKARDLIANRDFEIRAKKVICAVGPWTNSLLKLDNPRAKKKVRTTKGIHIVYKENISKHALFITAKSDNRIFFIIPWMGNSLIGTTDTDYISDPDEVAPSQKDVDYLLKEAARVLPGIEFTQDKIVMAFAGLRPLIRKGGSAAKVPRRHEFFTTMSNIDFVIGGKYTTYRKIAEDYVNKIRKTFIKREFRVYGTGHIKEKPEDIARKYKLSVSLIRVLMNKYGIRYKDVLTLIDENPKLKEKVSDNPPVIMAQIVYSAKVEMAQRPQDIIVRRLSLTYHGDISQRCLKAVNKVLKRIVK